MAQKEPTYKNTYVIDMEKVLNDRLMWTVLGASLPILTKNNKPENSVKMLSERLAKKMVKQYEQLSKIIGKTDAATIIEYLDTNGRPLITLYPTNDVDVHNNDWSNLAASAMADLQRIHDERIAMINRARNNNAK